MLGAIIGDIVGSIYEHDNIKTKDFPLFAKRATFTDDTVCTVAIADCLLSAGDFADYLRTWVHRYPHKLGTEACFSAGPSPTAWGHTVAGVMDLPCGSVQLPTLSWKSKRRCSWPSDPPS